MKEIQAVQAAKDASAVLKIVDAQWNRPSEILAKYLKKVTGADFERRKVCSGEPAFIFAAADHGEEGFAYRIEGANIIFEAKNEQAAVYAVYDFLERIVGCRYFTSTEEYVPADCNLTLCFENYSFRPLMEYREAYYRDFGSAEFAEKHKLARFDLHDRKENWGLWCHTFSTLVDPEVYYDEHPEYFAMDEQGNRLKNNSQLCLSNPDVLKTAVGTLTGLMKKKPECRFWSVSQNDNANYCHCPACEKMNAEDGGPMGSVLRFVNKVAGHFPDKIISTLAYWYTRKAPEITRPADNVSILLCNIEANRGMPIETDPRSEGTRQELYDWGKICGKVFLWDYCIQFANLVAPFPNFRVMPKNMRFFAENHVRMIFSQGKREIGGEFSALRGYLLAKLMWDPYCDADAVIDDFLHGYYRGAAKYIREYMDRMHDALDASGGELHIFGGPEDSRETYFTEELFRKYEELFQAAEAAVAGDGEALFRVRTAHMPVYYAALCLGYGSRTERRRMLDKFVEQAGKTGLEKVEEWHLTVGEFAAGKAAELAAEC